MLKKQNTSNEEILSPKDKKFIARWIDGEKRNYYKLEEIWARIKKKNTADSKDLFIRFLHVFFHNDKENYIEAKRKLKNFINGKE